MFADYTVFNYSVPNLDTLVRHVKNRLDNVADWCKYNKLPLRSDKCKYMFVTNRDILLRPTISMNNTPIEEISDFKFLGLQLDSKLKYSNHIN